MSEMSISSMVVWWVYTKSVRKGGLVPVCQSMEELSRKWKTRLDFRDAFPPGFFPVRPQVLPTTLLYSSLPLSFLLPPHDNVVPSSMYC